MDKSQSLWTRNFFNICFSSFFIFITFYSLTATLPTFVTDNLGGNQQQAGWVLTAYVIAAVLMRPFAGKWMDGPWRYKVLLIATAIFMVCGFFYPLISAFGVLLVLRFIHGLSFGAATTANATIVTDLIPDNRKGEGLGYYTLAMNLAMVLGPFMGLTVVQNASFNVLFIIFMVFGVLGLVLSIFIVKNRKGAANSKAATPKPAAQATSTEPTSKEKFSWRNYIEPKAVPISLTALFLAIAYAGILSFIPSYAKEIGLESISSYYFIVYAAMIVLARPFTGKLFDRLHRNYIVYPTLSLYVIGLIILATAHSSFMFLLSGAVIGLGFGSLFPCLQTIAVQQSPKERVGLATGTLYIFFDGGIGIGSALLGSIASATNNRVMYLCGVVSVLVGTALYFAFMHRKSSTQTKPAEAA